MLKRSEAVTRFFFTVWATINLGIVILTDAAQAEGRQPQSLHCEVLVIGGGLSGVAASYELLLDGKVVCLTELTDWLGGQVSSQGTSALDETVGQRTTRSFPRGYLAFRDRLTQMTGRSRLGDCWVSEVCFSPQLGHQVLLTMLKEAEKQGKGTLHWLPNTVIKRLETRKHNDAADNDAAENGADENGADENHAENNQPEIITQALAIQHQAHPEAEPLNTAPLSATLADSYSPQDSAQFTKRLISLEPLQNQEWIVIEATETGEILALANVPYRVGIDGQSYHNPSASSKSDYPYCTQALTYTFTMEATAEPQIHQRPAFYADYESFYSFDQKRYADTPNLVFSYRRIFSQIPGTDFETVNPGDISMQNWGGGNDYGPGNDTDNILLTQQQLAQRGQLAAHGWQGGLRIESLQKAEEHALGYFYWWATGNTDSKITPAQKSPLPQVKLLTGLSSPMGTVHGLSKFPYIRESRRLIGRSGFAYPNGFQVHEVDVSRQDYTDDYYKNNLSSQNYNALIKSLSRLQGIEVVTDKNAPNSANLRQRSRLFPDSVGIGHYPIDFHPCMLHSPPEQAGNIERPGERQGATRTYPYQIPLRAMIPQRIDNLLVTGKSIATSHISAATYRTQGFEWSAGAAAGTTAAFSLENGLRPYQLVENIPSYNPQLSQLQRRLNQNNNPTQFEGMSIFNENWSGW